MSQNVISLVRPDDWHLHLRDGEALKSVLPDTARRFARAIVMPNLVPPVRTLMDAQAYRDRIITAVPHGMSFEPLMTLYLTDNTQGDEIIRAKQSGIVQAVKYYPAGATTNSESGVDFVAQARDDVAGTLTAHHLLLNRNDMLVGGIRPHAYCLPVLKRELHRRALVAAATSGNSKFFLGTDSAPHAKQAKESACGCAGIYTSHAGIELYAEVFDNEGALDKLEAFASIHGPDFYGLPRNTDTITLQKIAWQVPSEISLGENSMVPFRAGAKMSWQLLD